MNTRSRLRLATVLAGALLITSAAYAAPEHQAHGCTAMAHSHGNSIYSLHFYKGSEFTLHEDFPRLSVKAAYMKSYLGLGHAGKPVTRQDDLMMLTVDVDMSKYTIVFEPNPNGTGVTVKGSLEGVMGGNEIEEFMCKAFLPLEEK